MKWSSGGAAKVENARGSLIILPAILLNARLEKGQSARREQKRPGPIPDSVLNSCIFAENTTAMSSSIANSDASAVGDVAESLIPRARDGFMLLLYFVRLTQYRRLLSETIDVI
jgi:hypothetical protein